MRSYSPKTLDDPGFNHIVMFILLMIATPHYIRNPYLITKFIEVCFNWKYQATAMVLLVQSRRLAYVNTA